MARGPGVLHSVLGRSHCVSNRNYPLRGERMFGRMATHKKAQQDEEVTEITADQLRELVGDKPSHTLTIGVHAKKSGQLGNIAYDIAEFVNVLREQTGVDYVLDVQAAVGSAESSGELAPVVGFIAQERADEEAEDDEEGRNQYARWKVENRLN